MALLVNNETVKEFVGTSAEVKPTLEAKNVKSTFYETDTKAISIWSGTAWILM